MEQFTDEYIKKVMESHSKKLQYYRDKYHNVKKHDETFIQKNRERATNWYNNELNKESKKQYYQNNKELMSAKSSYNYYKRKDNIETFKTKFPEKYKLLVDNKFIKL